MSRLISVLFVVNSVSVSAWAAKSAEPAPHPQSPLFEAAEYAEYSEARQLMKEDKWVEAVVLLRSAQRKAPSDERVALDLAKALAYSGRREEALTVLVQEIGRETGAKKKTLIRRLRVMSRLFLSNADFQIYQDGVNLMLAGKYRAARERFDKALEMEPANVEILVRLGQCLVLEGDNDSAAERLRIAKRLNPYEAGTRLWLGRSLHLRGELKEALEELRAAYLDLSGSETAPVWYADAVFASGQKNSAVQLLEKESAKNPVYVGTMISLAKLRLMSSSPKDTTAAWQARRELQVALSRMNDSSQTPTVAPPGEILNELTFDPRPSDEDVRKDIQKFMSEAERRINGSPAEPT